MHSLLFISFAQASATFFSALLRSFLAFSASLYFAVVAEEIRILADQSAKSAVHTRELVNNTLFEIKEGSEIAHRTANVLYGVVDAIQQIAATSKTLSENSQIQAESVEQADAGIVRISEVVQSNSAAAQESYATSEELSAQAMAMHELVSQFQLKEL